MNKERIYRYLQNSCTAEEKKQVQELLVSDPSFRKEFETLSAIYTLSSNYHYPTSTDTAKQWEKFRNDRNPAHPVNKSSRRWILVSAMASVVAVILTLTILLSKQPNTGTVYLGHEKGVVELSDGSVVWLHKGATLTLDRKFGTDNRNLRLEGAAYFNVTSGHSKPFAVNYNHTVVTVTGTVFEMAGNGNKLSVVSVSEGTVNVRTGGKLHMLESSQKLEVDNVTSEAVISPFVPSVPHWAGENMHFVEQRLELIVGTVSKFYGVHISMDHTLKNLIYTVNLSGLDENTALQTLATVTGLVLEKKDDTYLLKP